MTPTELSLRLLRRRHYVADVCERWVPHADIRKDLFGIGDIMAAHATEGVVMVQTTTLANLPTRVAKAKACAPLRTWLASGAGFHLHGWTKRGDKWMVKIVVLRPGDLAAVTIETPPRRRYRVQPTTQPDLFSGATLALTGQGT